MQRLFLSHIAVILCVPAMAAEAPVKPQGDLYIFGFALNQRPDKKSGQTIASYNWCPEEIERLFRAQSKSFHRNIQSRLVLDTKATRTGMMGGLAWLGRATAKDLAVIYIGCHGDTDKDKGWHIVTADGKTVWAHEIKTQLGKLACQVLIIIETCTSGGFAEAHKLDTPVPSNVTALCACSGKQTTDNQLDMAIAEGLYGRADFNKNGVVEIDELVRYVQLRYKEWWPTPRVMMASQTPVIVKSKSLAGSFPLTRVSAKLVAAVHAGTWYSALEEKRIGNKYQVHFLGWSSRPGPYFLANAVSREAICLPSEGRPLLVNQKGRWYPARLLSQSGAGYKVHYIGYNEQEVVAKNRIFFPFVGDPSHPNYPYSTAGAGVWGRIGPPAAWKDTRTGVILQDRLYSVETNGTMYVTDLSNGTWEQIGKAEFGDTTAMFAAGDNLYTLEKDGSLYRVKPKDGTWVRVGEAGIWKGTRAAAVLKDRLYTVDTGGALMATNLANGRPVQVGKTEFGNTVLMFAAGASLYTIETDGSLYRVNPTNGTWSRVGPEGGWKLTRAGVALKGRLYTVEATGHLYATDLASGKWTTIGKPEFAGTIAMFAAGDKVFTIEKDGSLYWVSVK